MKIYFDGFSSPHKHNRAGYCICIENSEGLRTFHVEYISAMCTNNQAELHGLIAALNFVPIGEDNFIIGDSKLIIDAFNNRLKFKDYELANLLKVAKQIGKKIPNLVVVWVERKRNVAGKYLEKIGV